MATAKKTLRARSLTTQEPRYGEKIRYSASLIHQGEKQFYSVTMPTDVLAKCCYVTTRQEDAANGFQRVLDKKRAQDIANYIDSGTGTIPGSIILSAQDAADMTLIGAGKTVEFTFSEKSFLVLDGQHRIYGFYLAQKSYRVPVVIYSGLTAAEEARLFIDINTKQRQVPNELLLDIKLLAQREDDTDKLLRELFDKFHEEESSPLFGLMSPASRQSKKISRVTFNLAFKPTQNVFNSKDPSHIYAVTSAYLSAFSDILGEMNARDTLTSPIIFRAIMLTFTEVARISAAQHGKVFTKGKFASVLDPIGTQLSAAKIHKMSKSVKDAAELFQSAIKKDFSI